MRPVRRHGTHLTIIPRASACLVGPVPSPGAFLDELLSPPRFDVRNCVQALLQAVAPPSIPLIMPRSADADEKFLIFWLRIERAKPLYIMWTHYVRVIGGPKTMVRSIWLA